MEKTLQRDLNELSRKIDHGVCSFCPLTKKRHEWVTEADGVKCIIKVFEKYSAAQDGNHASMTVALFETGGEVRLWAEASGTSGAMFFIPYNGCEGELTAALNTTLDIYDEIIL